MDLTTLVPLINTGGVVTLLIVILYGGMRNWWVFGHYYTAMQAEKDKELAKAQEEAEYWRELAVGRRGAEELGRSLRPHGGSD